MAYELPLSDWAYQALVTEACRNPQSLKRLYDPNKEQAYFNGRLLLHVLRDAFVEPLIAAHAAAVQKQTELANCLWVRDDLLIRHHNTAMLYIDAIDAEARDMKLLRQIKGKVEHWELTKQVVFFKPKTDQARLRNSLVLMFAAYGANQELRDDGVKPSFMALARQAIATQRAFLEVPEVSELIEHPQLIALQEQCLAIYTSSELDTSEVFISDAPQNLETVI